MKIIVNHMAIEYEEVGDGPVILMLHGWKDDLRTFDLLVRELPGYRIVRLDMPGFGKSDIPPRTDWRIDDYAAFIRDFLQKLRITPHAILGHSFGGRVAIKGLATGVLSADKLVLIAAAGVARRKIRRGGVMSGLAKAARALSYIPGLARHYEDARRAVYKKLGSDYYETGELRQIFLNTIEENLEEAARGLKLKALLVWGDRDAQTPLAEGKLLHELIAGSELVVYDGASHFIHRERPKEIAQRLVQFL